MVRSLSDATVCPICNLGRLEPRYRAAPLDYSIGQDYPVYVCSACGHGKTGGLAQHAAGPYAGGCYDVKEKAWHRLIRPLLSALENGKLRYLMAGEMSGRKLLEIGCGKGRFLEAARAHGLLVHGIEPAPRSFAFASARLGSQVAPVGLEEIDKLPAFPRKYDYVMLWHVLEHLDDPTAALSQVRNLLEADGRAVIAVPNFASLQARLGKTDWYHLDPPRHLHHFTPQSLRMLAVREGFEIDGLFFDSFYQNFVGEIVTLVNRVLPGKNVVFNGLRLNRAYFDRFGTACGWVMFILGLAVSALITLPVLLITLFAQLAGRSGTMVAVARPAGNRQGI